MPGASLDPPTGEPPADPVGPDDDTEWCTTPDCVRPVTFHPGGVHLTETGREFRGCGAVHPEYHFTCRFPASHEWPAHWDPDVGHCWLPDGHSTADRAAADQLNRLRSALELINRNGCSNFTRGRCTDPYSGRARDAHYGANRWCDACIAADALGVTR